MVHAALLRGGRHEGLLSVGRHGFMVEERAVQVLLLADRGDPFGEGGGGNGYEEEGWKGGGSMSGRDRRVKRGRDCA
jgi:hypothetical protein